MNVGVHEARADDAIDVCLDILFTHLFDDPVPNAEVALSGEKIIAIDYGSGEQSLAWSSHHPRKWLWEVI